ncbi:MAG: ABC transporter ATP-binding protein [Planctomycetota bacterium]|nr:ABC transporter ATP-binding protein [Planctomycetota bacterium]
MTETQPLVELNDVTKRYPSPTGEDGPPVLRGISLAVAEGEALAVVGPSGSGKSTLLNIIGTLDRPTAGRVRLAGQDLSAMDEEALAEVRTRRIGFVFQLHHLLPQCTALENVLVPALADQAAVPEEVAARGRALLERVGLADRMGYRPGHLSGGERQRVAVARALVNRPALLLADEPTGSLDREASGTLADLLLELNRADGVTLIVVTHAAALAERMGRRLELRDGTLTPMDPDA